MLWLLALFLLSMATLGSVLVYQKGINERLAGRPERRALPAPGGGPATERTPQSLQVGDVVVEGEEDWLVVGVATYREEDEQWFVYHLDDGARERFMEVRQRPEWVITMLEPAEDAPTFGQLGRGITFRGQPYQLVRRGDARVIVEGEAALPPGVMRYATYAGPGGAFLNIEERGDDKRGFAGATVELGSLMLMPGEVPEEDALADLG